MTSWNVRQPFVLFLLLTAITGAIYPLLITGCAQFLFPHQANGSLVELGTRTVGSELIGQHFAAPWYFWGRPSATEPSPYNAEASRGSNLGPLNPTLQVSVRQRLRLVTPADASPDQPVPVDLVTSSGSGLDPHVSVLGALYQVPRVARARNLSQEEVQTLVRQNTEDRQWGVFGEPRVNVLRLNMALDRASSIRTPR